MPQRLGAFFWVGLCLWALLAPLMLPSPSTIHAEAPLVMPWHSTYWLGTDDLGRDLLSRLTEGARLSLGVGLLSALTSVGVGTGWGLACAFGPKWLDSVLVRAMDILYSLPSLVIALLFSLFLKLWLLQWLPITGLAGLLGIVAAIAFFCWPDTARVVRAQAMRLREEPYLEAYQTLGGAFFRKLWDYLIPALTPTLWTSLLIAVPRAILTESTLSFIGLGIEPPLSSWGNLASDGFYLVRVAPHLLILPSLCIVLTLLALQALEPKTSR
jgi:ABC-type dipeptide/oligopeptide/nickel transport system permease subunit